MMFSSMPALDRFMTRSLAAVVLSVVALCLPAVVAAESDCNMTDSSPVFP